VSSEPALDQGHYAGGRVTKPSKPKLITRFHDIRTFEVEWPKWPFSLGMSSYRYKKRGSIAVLEKSEKNLSGGVGKK
jgi:hypothetical protein